MRRWRDQQGSAGVMVAISMTTVVALAAVGIDLGRLYAVRSRISAAVDTAALAGAQRLPQDSLGAVDQARLYLDRNGLDGAAAEAVVDAARNRLRLTAGEQVAMSFARVMGITGSRVAATAVAFRGFLSGVQGAVPLGVRKGDYSAGQQVLLKVDAHSNEPNYSGNFMALALGERGASAYEDNLRAGYGAWLRIGEWLATETGNMAGPTRRALTDRLEADPGATWDRVARRSSRLLLVPVVNDFEVNGRDEVQVVGLAVIFLEGVSSGGGGAEVTGRFLRYVVDGELTPDAAADFGASVIRLES